MSVAVPFNGEEFKRITLAPGSVDCEIWSTTFPLIVCVRVCAIPEFIPNKINNIESVIDFSLCDIFLRLDFMK
jgi:hypothetical protein